MIDYGRSGIRKSALTELGRIKAEPDSTIRYPYIIGVVRALLSEDPEMCEAIQAAFMGAQGKEMVEEKTGVGR